MLRWCRERVVRVAVALVVSLTGLGAWADADHGRFGHDAHGQVWVVHDAAAHAFTSGDEATSADELRCVLCHVTRTVRPSVDASTLAPRHDVRPLAALVPLDQQPRIFPAAEPPLRSPPVLL
jgi:hypothetical protein